MELYCTLDVTTSTQRAVRRTVTYALAHGPPRQPSCASLIGSKTQGNVLKDVRLSLIRHWHASSQSNPLLPHVLGIFSPSHPLIPTSYSESFALPFSTGAATETVCIANFHRYPAFVYPHLEFIADPFSDLEKLRFGTAGAVIGA